MEHTRPRTRNEPTTTTADRTGNTRFGASTSGVVHGQRDDRFHGEFGGG